MNLENAVLKVNWTEIKSDIGVLSRVVRRKKYSVKYHKRKKLGNGRSTETSNMFMKNMLYRIDGIIKQADCNR